MHNRQMLTAALAALTVVGCAAGGQDQATQAKTPAAGTPTPSTPEQGSQPAETPAPSTSPLAVNVKDGATQVPVSTLVTVTGNPSDVQVTTNASGKNAVPKITGKLNDKGSWVAHDRLDPGARYTVTATGPAGESTKASFTTATLSRSQEVFPTLSPVINGPYGVAQPIVVHFDVPVKNKAEFERNMHVTSTPAQEGSWGWYDDRTVHYRPKQHWKPGTKISLDARLNGVDAGGGNYGQLNRTLDLEIGRNQSGKVDIARHTITWLRDGKPVGTWPMTAGKPGFTTRSGTKLVMEKAEHIKMNSETTGIAQDSSEGYNVPVAYALRVTSSGEFIHSAPWNTGNFGVRNASHGCVGMDESQMYKLYTTAQIGDPVVFTGSSRKLEVGNGWTEWDMTWEQWKKKSALS